MKRIGLTASEEMSFENVDRRTDDGPNFIVFRQKDAVGIANSEDPDQTAPLGEV